MNLPQFLWCPPPPGTWKHVYHGSRQGCCRGENISDPNKMQKHLHLLRAPANFRFRFQTHNVSIIRASCLFEDSNFIKLSVSFVHDPACLYFLHCLNSQDFLCLQISAPWTGLPMQTVRWYIYIYIYSQLVIKYIWFLGICLFNP